MVSRGSFNCTNMYNMSFERYFHVELEKHGGQPANDAGSNYSRWRPIWRNIWGRIVSRGSFNDRNMCNMSFERYLHVE